LNVSNIIIRAGEWNIRRDIEPQLHQVSISLTFYEQLLHMQIPKGQKDRQVVSLFCAFGICASESCSKNIDKIDPRKALPSTSQSIPASIRLTCKATLPLSIWPSPSSLHRTSTRPACRTASTPRPASSHMAVTPLGGEKTDLVRICKNYNYVFQYEKEKKGGHT